MKYDSIIGFLQNNKNNEYNNMDNIVLEQEYNEDYILQIVIRTKYVFCKPNLESGFEVSIGIDSDDEHIQTDEAEKIYNVLCTVFKHDDIVKTYFTRNSPRFDHFVFKTKELAVKCIIIMSMISMPSFAYSAEDISNLEKCLKCLDTYGPTIVKKIYDACCQDPELRKNNQSRCDAYEEQKKLK